MPNNGTEYFEWALGVCLYAYAAWVLLVVFTTRRVPFRNSRLARSSREILMEGWRVLNPSTLAQRMDEWVHRYRERTGQPPDEAVERRRAARLLSR